MHDFVISFHITKIPIALFEHLAGLFQAPETLTRRILDNVAEETFLISLSTCNRIELYGTSANENCAEECLRSLAALSGLGFPALRGYAEIYTGKAMHEHLFHTIAGLKSIAVGETEIQGQIRTAYQLAREHKTVNDRLGRIMEAALHAGKRARQQTGIEQAKISLGNLALRTLKQRGSLAPATRAAIIGTGKMARNAAEYLLKTGISSEITMLSSAPEQRLQQLAYLNPELQSLDMLQETIATADLIFCAYGTERQFLTPELLAPVAANRSRPLYVIDIALPRDADPAIGDIPGIELIDFPALHAMELRENLLGSEEIERARAILAEELNCLDTELRLSRAGEAIASFRQRAEQVRKVELDRTLRSLEHLSEHEQKQIQKLTHRIVRELLKAPTIAIRERAQRGEIDHEYERIIAEIFTPRNENTAPCGTGRSAKDRRPEEKNKSLTV